ncbi:MAG TPA: serine protease [Ferruginibacter sp.]|jgi:serine protease Do|nr:serine protease [Ferruginibacter sp.]
MEDLLILENLERYVSGEMSQQEKIAFEELRKTDPHVDQLAVEHSYFLHELDRYSALKNYRHSLHEVENKLAEQGLITQPQIKGAEKVIYLWKRYRRNIAVAASIAALISFVSTGVVVNYAKNTGNENYELLVNKINQTNNEIIKLKRSTTQVENASSRTKEQQPTIGYRGTGFLIDGKGYLVTNAHVVETMKSVYVENNKGEYFSASTVYLDKNADLAVLKIKDSSFKTYTYLPYSIKKTNADLGEQIFILGFPKSEVVYGEGYLSANSGNDGDSTAYQLSIPANPGNSGGPVVNSNGEIIGIITGKDTKADGVVYAIKSKNIFNLISEAESADTTNSLKIKAPAGYGLKGLSRVQQVKKMEDFVFMVVGN